MTRPTDKYSRDFTPADKGMILQLAAILLTHEATMSVRFDNYEIILTLNDGSTIVLGEDPITPETLLEMIK